MCDATPCDAKGRALSLRARHAQQTDSRGKHGDSGIATVSVTTTCGEKVRLMNRVCATGPPGKPAWATTMPPGSKHRLNDILRTNEDVVNNGSVVAQLGGPTLETTMPRVWKPRLRQHRAYKKKRCEQREGRRSSWRTSSSDHDAKDTLCDATSWRQMRKW